MAGDEIQPSQLGVAHGLQVPPRRGCAADHHDALVAEQGLEAQPQRGSTGLLGMREDQRGPRKAAARRGASRRCGRCSGPEPVPARQQSLNPPSHPVGAAGTEETVQRPDLELDRVVVPQQRGELGPQRRPERRPGGNGLGLRVRRTKPLQLTRQDVELPFQGGPGGFAAQQPPAKGREPDGDHRRLLQHVRQRLASALPRGEREGPHLSERLQQGRLGETLGQQAEKVRLPRLDGGDQFRREAGKVLRVGGPKGPLHILGGLGLRHAVLMRRRWPGLQRAGRSRGRLARVAPPRTFG